jgi:hypothetical protein
VVDGGEARPVNDPIMALAQLLAKAIRESGERLRKPYGPRVATMAGIGAGVAPTRRR